MGDGILSFSRVTAPGASPDRWMILLHGIFGTGGNLRTLARRLAERQPTWGFVLPDLRGHGGSLGLAGPDLSTPRAWFEEAVRDIVRLEASLGHPVQGLGGHSFGGKVALARLALGPPSIERLQPLRFVLLDSAPGADPERLVRDQVGQILHLLESMPRPIRSRDAFLDAITSAGHSRPIAEWLAMQVRRAPSPSAVETDELELRLELPALRAMLAGYFATDLWKVLEHPPPEARVLVVVGGRSQVVHGADLERLREVAAEGNLELRVLPRAGHWLHADDLDGLVDVVAPHLAPA